ncbi:hypothetical protein K469DRAFT_356589 [Zopfia rhizophila CBS 207.26]|uniref:Transposase IS30-like HTH domain-containing protein n=1 Tax=Zopfia rhizophila CBS 207.26 TaxID=1314779 RepID=A0A6A6DHT8_9PEZI|nr:hypothetical protein K469DRAFT_356589 [Zopfia rhizophila CBS 207.26]
MLIKITVANPQRQLTHDERLHIQTLRQEGLSIQRIVNRVGVSRSTIHEVIHGATTPTKPRGRHSILDTPTHRRLVFNVTLNVYQQRKPWRQIAQGLGISVLDHALTAAFHMMGYYRRKVHRKPFLTAP